MEQQAYTIIITLLCAALVGMVFNDLRGYMAAQRPQMVQKVVTVVLSDTMTFHAAQNVCQLCGWRLERRGRQLILWQGYACQHSAVMA